MSKQQHTPAPWYVDNGASYIVRGRDQVVCKAHHGKGTQVKTDVAICTIPKQGVRADSEKLANAKLIAAAPDLYTVLHSVFQSDAYSYLQPQVKDAMRDALKKARGES